MVVCFNHMLLLRLQQLCKSSLLCVTLCQIRRNSSLQRCSSAHVRRLQGAHAAFHSDGPSSGAGVRAGAASCYRGRCCCHRRCFSASSINHDCHVSASSFIAQQLQCCDPFLTWLVVHPAFANCLLQGDFEVRGERLGHMSNSASKLIAGN